MRFMQVMPALIRVTCGLTKKRLIAGSILAFAAALPLNSYYVEYPYPNGKTGFPGWGCLLSGWAMPLDLSPKLYVVEFAWYANPLLLLSWFFILKEKRKLAGFFGLASLAIMISFRFQNAVPITESGSLDKILSFGPSYWLWLLSGALAFSSVFLISRSERRRNVAKANGADGHQTS
jgi:hypothetical protein